MSIIPAEWCCGKPFLTIDAWARHLDDRVCEAGRRLRPAPEARREP